MATPIEIYYWPSCPGRGEFLRLLLEDQSHPYVDVTRGDEKKGQGIPAMMKLLQGEGTDTPPLSPPFIKDGDKLIGQTANILQYLANRLGFTPKDEKGKLYAQQILLTIMDVVDEVHDTHHPIDTTLYYKDQKEEAKKRSQVFCTSRIPKFLNYFEKVITKSGSQYLVGDSATYVDVALFYLIQGLSYAFPKATARTLATTPKIQALYELIGNRPNIKKYLTSEHHVGFNENGIFRQYPELDF